MTRASMRVQYDLALVEFSLEGSKRWVNQKFPVMLKTMQAVTASKVPPTTAEVKPE